MRFRPQLEAAFQEARAAALTRGDMGVAALSSCLWITQMLGFALAGEGPTLVKALLLLAVNFLPLFEGQHWQVCRSRNRCLTIFKTMLFTLLCWEAGQPHALPPANTAAELAEAACPAALQTPWLDSGSDSGVCLVDAPACFGLPAEAGQAGAAPWAAAGVAGAAAAAAPQPPCGFSRLVPLFTEVGQSKLFALMHAGLAFRYSRWQHTAILQTALTAAAAAQCAWQDVCSGAGLGESTGTLQCLAAFLTNSHMLPLPAVSGAKSVAPVASGLAGNAKLAGGSSAGTLPLASSPTLALPPHLDACRLVIFWAQLCFGWALPVWAAVLGESHARARFALQHSAALQPDEREWAVAAIVGSDWMAAAYQLPMLCLFAWHLLLAAAVTLTGRGAGEHMGAT